MNTAKDLKVSGYYDVSGYKIMSLGEEKRRHIIEAAMKEFTKGYRKANTSAIAAEANISKGLLFHYFSTKKELFFFLIKYSLSIIIPEYDKVGASGKDFFESLWEMTLVKLQLIKKYGDIYEFMFSAYLSAQKEFPEEFKNMSDPATDLLKKMYARADKSLIREGIDPDKACKLMLWAIKGYAEEITARMAADKITALSEIEPDIQRLYDEWKEYIAILRKAFYRN